MQTTTESWAGRLVLMLGNVAGLLDIVILPLWVGGLIESYKFDPQLAGGLVTLFLFGILVSNALLAFRFYRMPAKAVVSLGLLVPGVAFLCMTQVSGSSSAYVLAALNLVGGLGAGAGLAMISGVIGRSQNPHQLFAFATFGVSAFAVVFFAITPAMMASMGVNAVFINAGVMMLVASLASVLAFPKIPERSGDHEAEPRPGQASSLVLGTCFFGIVFFQMANAVTLSFVERIGNFRGFDSAAIGTMLAVGGFVPILAPILAALLEKRLSPVWVVPCGMLFHGFLSLVLFSSSTFLPFAAAYVLVASTVMFTATFAFGLLAKLDPSARMNALMPTMMAAGSAAGPFFGGTVAKYAGFPQVGVASAGCAALGALCFLFVAACLRRPVVRIA